jgi:hypothetical protein
MTVYLNKKTAACSYSQRQNKIRVDRDAGIIYDLAIMTIGTANPANWQAFEVDAVTLQQVADAINKANGVKSRITHPELDRPENPEDFNIIVGRIHSARITGDQVRGDFTVSAGATAEQKNRIFALAEEMPGSIGLSAVLPDVEIAHENGKQVARLSEVRAVDWVGTPAANPAGLLSSLQSSGTLPAEPKTSQPMKGIAMNYTEEQMKYLQSLGLAPDATPEAIDAFVAGLTPEQKSGMPAAASAPAPAPATGATPAPAVPAPAATPATGAAQPNAVAARLAHIRETAALSGQPEAWVLQQFDSNQTPDQIRAAVLSQRRASQAPAVLSGSPSITGGSNINHDSLTPAITDAIMLRCGIRPVVIGDDGAVVLSAGRTPQTRAPHARAAEFRPLTLVDMGRRYLESIGYTKAATLSRSQLAGLLMSRQKLRQIAALAGAHSTSDFPDILADVMGKSLRQAYSLAPLTWNRWCKKVTTPDFKPIKRLQLGITGTMQEIPEGGEYTFGTLTESKETYAVGTFGFGLSFTRQMLINDDLDAFSRIAPDLGRRARVLEERTAYGILTANAALADGGALFNNTAVTTPGGHANLGSGVITVENIGALRALMQAQQPLGTSTTNPDYLATEPRYMLVPSSKDFLAKQVVSSTVDPSKSNAAINPVNSLGLEVISSPYLQANSGIIWYLLADPNDIDTVEMAFLEGEESPVIEEEDEFDNDTRKMKVRHNLRAKAIDFRGMVRSTGS